MADQKQPITVLTAARGLGRLVPIALLPLALAAGSGAADLPGRTLELYPPHDAVTCDEGFLRVVNGLRPGDELRLHGGVYSQICGRRLRQLRGKPDRPILIRAAPGETPVLTRPRGASGSYPQNNLDIEDAAYLVIRGLTLRGGSSGIRFSGTNDHVTLEDNEILETDNNAIAMNSGATDSFVIRHNHIHHTGLLPLSLGTTEGEGLYVGCNEGRCVASNHLIERNYIHHLRGTSEGGNDGIEIKTGSYGNVVRDNVIHDTTIGTRFPCIFVYGGGPRENIVEGNAMWHCGEAIQVVSDAVIRNNIIALSDVGITAAPHQQVPTLRRVTIVNNTVYGHRECLVIRWEGARRMVLANNAIYCPTGKAVDAQGLEGRQVVVRANMVQGTPAGSAGSSTGGLLSGGAATAAFGNPGAMDYWPRPGSPLLGQGARDLAPATDFNGRRRTRAPDVGAYEAQGRAANPGWRLVPGFKGE